MFHHWAVYLAQIVLIAFVFNKEFVTQAGPRLGSTNPTASASQVIETTAAWTFNYSLSW